MADNDAPCDDTLSLAAKQRQDELCDEFEAAWRTGAAPRIEDGLVRVPPEERAALFTALLRCEIEVRPPPITMEEYRTRFPLYAGEVEAVFRNPADTTLFPPPPWRGPPLPEIPDYAIITCIGAGAMGIVYRAVDLKLDREVAIKVMRAGAWFQPKDLSRFRREARAVAGLNHPNVVHLYAYGQVDGLPFFVMEYVETGSLASRLNGEPVDPTWSVRLVETLARAVQYVHEQNIVHRDLKPANILLTPQETPKIADFGLAKKLTGDDPDSTESNVVVGTVSYMSPEAAAGKVRAIGPPSDIYTLGVILFELLTGRVPFRGDTVAAIIAQVVTDDAPRPTELVPTLPRALEAICLQCLEKDPFRRYATAAALADDLKHFRDGGPVSVVLQTTREQHARWAEKIGFRIADPMGCTPWWYLYSAQQGNVNRTVLLKRSTGRIGTDQHAAMGREAQIMADLDHPNIVRMYEFGERLDFPYLITEFPEGGVPLSRRLRETNGQTYDSTIGREQFRADGRPTPFEPRRAATVALRIALGIQAIHERRFVHGALNPSDIFLTSDDVPKIGNFAAAARIGESAALPPDWVPPNYLPPEILLEQKAPLFPAADIYGLGAILHDMLVGVPPFVAPDVARTCELVLHEAPAPPSRVDPRIPGALDAICLKCLAKDPAARYERAGELLLDLQQWLTRKDPSTDRTPVPQDREGWKPPAAYQLRIDSGPHNVNVIVRISPYRIVIGRSRDCGLVLEDETLAVSRQHCAVAWNHEASRHELIDFGAHNGTWLNGQRILAPQPLATGDRIGVGGYKLVFEASAPDVDNRRGPPS